MKLAVETRDAGPALLGPILAVPSTWPSSMATTVSPGGRSTQMSLASSSVMPGS